jgi:hypothetical protein
MCRQTLHCRPGAITAALINSVTITSPALQHPVELADPVHPAALHTVTLTRLNYVPPVTRSASVDPVVNRSTNSTPRQHNILNFNCIKQQPKRS